MKKDLSYADGLIAQAVSVGSWKRNEAWIHKFQDYVTRVAQQPDDQCRPVRTLIQDEQLILAFLAAVAREKPEAKTRVDAAKRALNFVRSIAGLHPLDQNINIRMLAKATRNRRVVTVKQSPHLPVSFIHCMMSDWGMSAIWWKRQTVLMTLLAFCSMGRGDEVCACLRRGIAWVLQNGRVVSSDKFVPGHHCKNKNCKHQRCVRGFLLLFPSRKNRQNSPSWIPVASAAAVRLMSAHLRWLDRAYPTQCKHLFVPRRPSRASGKRVYTVPTDKNAKMRVQSFRGLLRQCIEQCCGLKAAVAAEYGTHSPRLGAVELLRKHGVSAEMRQQMGQWMSRRVALRYLQLNPGEQFDVLQSF